ncbi:MAG: amino acid adenylation domain-containing protein, partial [Psychrosphaera sp.]|nr:amino acid adenylation domain-containing protein [Psychrosphaera sp.]
FDETTINRMIGHYQTLLEAMVLSPNLTVGELSLLTGSQQHYLLNTLNATYASNQQHADKSPFIHELFEQHVALAPHNIALVFEQQKLDYQAVNQKANRLAHYLRTKGVKPDTLVGLCVQRSMDMVIGLLAILKAGGAYVPLDPNYPQDRLDYMVKDSGVSLVLTQKELGQNLDQYPTSNPLKMAGQTAANLAYVIYTSGSTGLPKGVMVEHRNVVRLLTATQNKFHFDDQDVWTLFHSYAFDFSVWEIWGALAFGGRLVVVPDWMPRSVDDFYQLLVDEKVTVLNQTPSAFNPLSSIDAQQLQPLSLRVVIFGGEALNLQDLASWVDRHGDNKPELVNMYGITETTVHVTYRRILAQDINHNKGSLIGRPLDDLSFYILNPQLTPVPIGVCGEFFVGGNGVTRGYLNQPELTASRFIVSPFDSEQTLYCTGDLGRYLPNGEIEYLGRIDEQVKIRGFRIELGEIEQQLVLLPQIKSTVVLVREDQPGLKHLVAYVVCEQDVAEEALANTLRSALQAILPEHMVPSFFVKLDAFKLTNNGKIDKKWLLSEQMAPDSTLSAGEYVTPATITENKLAEIWSALLNITLHKISATANFFELGGHSLLSVRLTGEVRVAFDVELAVRDIFAVPMLSDLALFIDNSANKARFSAVVPITRQSNQLPVSFAQQRLWFIDQMDGASAQYNMPAAIRFKGHFIESVVEQAFARIVNRHEPLRTVFVSVEDGVQQLIRDDVEFKLTTLDLT